MTAHTPSTAPSADDTLVRAPLSPQQEPKATGSRTKLVVGGLLGLIVLGAIAVYLIGYVSAGDRLPRDAVVSGVAVGGLDPQAAEDKLRDELGEQAEQPLTVVVNGDELPVAPARAGLSIDYAASVAQAGGARSFDPRDIWQVLTGGSATDAVVVVDEAKLTAAVSTLAEQTDAAAKDATLAFDGRKIEKTKSVDGVTVQQEAAVSSIRTAYPTTDPVDVPADVVQPDITTVEVDQLVRSFAKPAVSGPVTVDAGRAGEFEVTPRMIANSITFVDQDGKLVPRLDADQLRSEADDVVADVETTKPKDATVKIVGGLPKVVPAVNGTSVTAEDLAAAVEPVLTKEGRRARTVQVELTGAQAKFSTADAEKLGIKRVIGEFTTYFPYAEYRNVNISRAAELINNTLLEPGETFSLNGVVGERTRANGFVEGFIIKGGRLREELGGGVSQSATTTFNAMFFAGLEDVQHQPHTLYFDRYPAGREATVAWPSLDLKFRNNTDYGVLVQAYVKKSTPSRRGSITVKMWSTKTYDKVESSKLRKSNYTSGRSITDKGSKCVPQVPTQGFRVNYERLFSDDGKVVKTEKFSWRYAPTDRVRCED